MTAPRAGQEVAGQGQDHARPLGIIAGGGNVPLRLARTATAAGRPVHVVALEGFADPSSYAAWPHLACRLGAAGRMLDWLRGQGVVELVLSGQVKRPSFLTLRPDAGAMKLAARIGKRAMGGDDQLLAAVAAVLEEEGFRVLASQEVMGALLAPPGLLAGPAPDAVARLDIRRGIEVVRALGGVDVGQGAVVQQGMVLGVEAIEGTDALLARVAGLKREGPGGVLVKLVKPGQDRRVDLPTIGPATVAGAARAGLAGIAVETAGCIMAEREQLLAMAAEAGLFVLGLQPDDFLRETDGETR